MNITVSFINKVCIFALGAVLFTKTGTHSKMICWESTETNYKGFINKTYESTYNWDYLNGRKLHEVIGVYCPFWRKTSTMERLPSNRWTWAFSTSQQTHPNIGIRRWIAGFSTLCHCSLFSFLFYMLIVNYVQVSEIYFVKLVHVWHCWISDP